MKFLIGMTIFVSFLFGKIDINHGEKQELVQLKYIGDKKAERIIAYREKNGCFKKIEHIMKVKGIAGKIFQKIKDNIEAKPCE
ncbi:MAG: helix-hairpin-helix domain-containing protein [Campylobacterales bacterium]|nr:helix-hairpin-helix domain-containing protein [Campylobacterales bacterium]